MIPNNLKNRRLSILSEVRENTYPDSTRDLESDSNIYELLRSSIGRLSLRLNPDRNGLVHPEEDVLMHLLDSEESPILILNCPENITLTSLEQTLNYLDKHKDKG